MAHQRLFRKLKEKGFTPKHVAEVGVYLPETSNVYEFILAGTKCTLVEPDPAAADAIRAHFSSKDNVTLHPVAVYDKHGAIELVRRGGSTYAAAIEQSPAVVNDRYRLRRADRFEVDAVTFDEIDDGSIDLLSVDIEGAEWFVLKHMVSRPTVISLETHGALYTNPYISEIAAWMRNNRYNLWYKDKSDSVYVRMDAFRVTSFDKVRLLRANTWLLVKRIEKYAKRRLQSRKS